MTAEDNERENPRCEGHITYRFGQGGPIHRTRCPEDATQTCQDCGAHTCAEHLDARHSPLGFALPDSAWSEEAGWPTRVQAAGQRHYPTGYGWMGTCAGNSSLH